MLFLILLFFIACSPVKKYQDLPEVKAWENDIHKFEQLDKSEKYSEDAILFAGSSSIRLWTTLETDMAPYPVIQRGYGGAKLSDFAVYADRIFAPHPCRAIVIFIANDITGSDQIRVRRKLQHCSSMYLRLSGKHTLILLYSGSQLLLQLQDGVHGLKFKRRIAGLRIFVTITEIPGSSVPILHFSMKMENQKLNYSSMTNFTLTTKDTQSGLKL